MVNVVFQWRIPQTPTPLTHPDWSTFDSPKGFNLLTLTPDFCA